MATSFSISSRLSETPVTLASWPSARDVFVLGKPRLSLLVFCTTGVGLAVAPTSMGSVRALLTLLCTALVVFAANGLNSYLERDVDARMQRTRKRPIPAGRIEPAVALVISFATALVSVGALFLVAGPLTALLAFIAFASYVWLYTPMKQVHWAAVLVGAVPGAIPPMMGWTAAEGALGAGAWALFALLFVWQLPHFFAIALSLSDDYRRGGLIVLPHTVGAATTRYWTVTTAALLLPVSVLPSWVGIASWPYAIVAIGSGIAFLALCARPPAAGAGNAWARRVFLASIVHMTALLLGLLLDAGLSRAGATAPLRTHAAVAAPGAPAGL